MQPTKKANAPSAVAVTVMVATAANAMANVVIAQSAQSAAMTRMPPQRKHLRKPLTVVKAILPLRMAAPPKAQALTTVKMLLLFLLRHPLPRRHHLWLTLP